jgi:hypothetical protein
MQWMANNWSMIFRHIETKKRSLSETGIKLLWHPPVCWNSISYWNVFNFGYGCPLIGKCVIVRCVFHIGVFLILIMVAVWLVSVSFYSAVTRLSPSRLTFVGMHLPLRTRNFSLPNTRSTQPHVRCVLGVSPLVKRRDRIGPHFWATVQWLRMCGGLSPLLHVPSWHCT